MKRRHFLASASMASGSLLAHPEAGRTSGKADGRIQLAVKDGMVRVPGTLKEKYTLLKELGYDGLELGVPGSIDPDLALAASREAGLPLHGAVNMVHWQTKMSSPDEAERARAVEKMKSSLQETSRFGGTSVLLVPGVVGGKVTQKEAWERSIREIRKCIPLAARLGVHILIENVWNGMFYDPKGPNTQTADRLKNYLDEIDSPWVGSYFDIGNHQRFGKPAGWIRTLGRRIVKLDVKDWGIKGGFTKIGEGDVDWPDVRKALRDIGYAGWATAEVGGGDKKRLAEILQNMRTHLLGL